MMLYVPAGVPLAGLPEFVLLPPHAELNNKPPANKATKQNVKKRLCLRRDSVNPANPIGANQMA